MLSSETLMAIKKVADIMKENDKYKAVTAAAEKYEKDPVISASMTEYSVQQQALAEEYKKAERDDALCTAIQNRINELYETIIASPVYEEYKKASDEYEVYYNAVYDELNYQLTGKRASCTGDCSSCSGCGK